MIEDMVAAGHPPPLFDARSHRFSVTLQNRRDLEKVIPEWEQHMNERQLKAMQFVQAQGSITNRITGSFVPMSARKRCASTLLILSTRNCC